MPFLPEPTKAPNTIGNITIILKDAVATDDEDAYQSGHFQIAIEFDDGSTIQRKGDLESHITPAERTALMGFLTALRARAINEILTT